MFNLIKAQQYRTLRDYTTYIIIIVGAAIYCFATMLTLSDSSSDSTGAGNFFLMAASAQSGVGNLLLMGLTAVICGSDMLDRTMNFELLDGAKRSRVFFSRFILSLCWGLVVIYAIVLLPVLFISLTSGWGNVITAAGFAKRMVMLLFPYVRMIALYTALTFILGDYRAVVAIGFIICEFELVADMMLQEIAKLPPYVRALFSVTSVNVLLDVDNMGFDYVDAKDISVVKDTLTLSDNIICAVVCVVFTVLLLALGLGVFKKKDLK